MGSSEELFRKVKGNAKKFIETGTYYGDGVQKAISAGFEKIYTCDINPFFIDEAKKRFPNNDVQFYRGASEKVLPKILREINEECVIFLDGHAMPYDAKNPILGFGEDTQFKKNKPCPLLEELDIIKNHSINTHTILIDDLQCMNTWMFNWIAFEDIFKKIKEINKNYEITIWQNVVCAIVKKENE